MRNAALGQASSKLAGKAENMQRGRMPGAINPLHRGLHPELAGRDRARQSLPGRSYRLSEPGVLGSPGRIGDETISCTRSWRPGMILTHCNTLWLEPTCKTPFSIRLFQQGCRLAKLGSKSSSSPRVRPSEARVGKRMGAATCKTAHH